ncbi:histidine kinase [Enterovibrio norvegicus FF-162]|uniref:response regulator n=1 Tax=Enterovibrio norvegicus TaxID=188144 RepID=UPI0003065355|nr:response regulator [Enterovibrio norvegicus]OEE74568.1 histidine kinase [Enterovibrio norvegicus FF-162]
MKGLVKNEPLIVLADEDLSHIDFHQQVLSESGYWLRSVATPAKLTTILEQHPVNILVLNIDFKFEGGESLSAAVKRIRLLSTCKDTRIILTSDVFSQEKKQAAYRSGASDFLTYPIAPDELYLKMETHLVAGARKGISGALSRSFNLLSEMNMALYPLVATAVSCTQMLKQTSLSNKQSVYVESISGAMKRASVIGDNLRDFEELSVGSIALENTPFDLGQLLESLRDYFVGEAESRSVELLFSVPLDVPRSLVGDPDRLRRILLNLISEAIVIGGGCPIILSINAGTLSESSVTLEFAVHQNITDDASPCDDLDELAERAAMAMSELDESLNLLIACYLIEKMGGEIHQEGGSEDSGIYFNLELQVAKVSTDKSFAVPVDLRGLRVLVVDDNPSSIAVHSAIISSLGFHCESAIDVDSAFHAIKEGHLDLDGEPFDLVLLDWHMPGKKGFHLLEKLRSDLTPEQIPLVIVISAFDRAIIEKDRGNGKIDGYLHKPISASVMFDTMMEVLGENLPKTHSRVLAAQGKSNAVTVSGGGKRILVVDDMSINQQIAKEVLISNDFQVDVAESGREAVVKVCPAPELYDAILMDLEMPDMNGLEATRIIRETADEESLPIFALTAHTMERDRQRCLDAGMNDHVSKPLDADVLLQKLAVYLGLAVTSRDNSTPEEIEQKEEYEYVDISDGIKRVMGNETLYFKLLSDFVHQARSQENQVCALIESGKLTEAAENVHTIAGSAGNLSVIALRNSAKQLQNALLALGDYQASLSQFRRDVDNAIKEIGNILLKRSNVALSTVHAQSDETKAQGNAGGSPKTGNGFRERLILLESQIMTQDMMAIDNYYQMLVDFCDMASKLKPVGDKLIELDYPQALIALKTFKTEQNLSTETTAEGGAFHAG